MMKKSIIKINDIDVISNSPIKVFELSKNKTKLPVDLDIIDINPNYIKEDEDELDVKDYIESRLLMQNYYDENVKDGVYVYISIDKDNPQLLKDKINISETDFNMVQEFIKKYYDVLNEYVAGNINIIELRNRIYIA